VPFALAWFRCCADCPAVFVCAAFPGFSPCCVLACLDQAAERGLASWVAAGFLPAWTVVLVVAGAARPGWGCFEAVLRVSAPLWFWSIALRPLPLLAVALSFYQAAGHPGRRGWRPDVLAR